MRPKSFSARQRKPQDTPLEAYRRAIAERTVRVMSEPWLKHPLPVLEAFIAAHAAMPRAPRKTTRKRSKPASKRAAQRQRAANKQLAALQRQGRAEWDQFKKEYPQVARETLAMLKHFRSI